MATATYDKEAEALYVYLHRKAVATTFTLAAGMVLLDIAQDGQLIGIEVLGVESIVNASIAPAEVPEPPPKEQLVLNLV